MKRHVSGSTSSLVAVTLQRILLAVFFVSCPLATGTAFILIWTDQLVTDRDQTMLRMMISASVVTLASALTLNILSFVWPSGRIAGREERRAEMSGGLDASEAAAS